MFLQYNWSREGTELQEVSRGQVLSDPAPGDQLVSHRDDCEHQQNMNQTTNGGTGDQAQGPKYDKYDGDCKQHDVYSFGQLTESVIH